MWTNTETKGEVTGANFKNEVISFSVHRHFACGNELFLSCTKLNINRQSLKCADVETAKAIAMEAVKGTLLILLSSLNKQ